VVLNRYDNCEFECIKQNEKFKTVISFIQQIFHEKKKILDQFWRFSDKTTGAKSSLAIMISNKLKQLIKKPSKV
jgi:hypothetical protein